MTKFFMMVGLPGSGKTTVAKKIAEELNAEWISSDAIRAELWGDENDQQSPEEVFHKMEVRTKSAIASKKHVIYDATNINSKSRKLLVSELKRAFPDIETSCVITICSMKECKLRQRERERKVPDEVIDRMARQFQVPYFNEGWDFIYLYPTGKLQDIDREHQRMMQIAHDNPHHTTSSLGAHNTKTLTAMQNLLAEVNETEDIKKMLCEVAYQHDIGKRKTKVFYNSKNEPTEEAHYYGHDNLGAYLWLSGNKSEEWDPQTFLTIGLLIQLHMSPYFFPNKSREELEAWGKKKGYDDWIIDWIWLIHQADRAAH